MADSDLLRARLQTSLGAAYTLDRELGGGGMARVFVATDTRLQRLVVVKVLAPDLVAGLSTERFAREIKLAAGLQAPHIVPVLADGVTADGLPYYTMPYVAGESLRARLDRGPVPPAEAVAILRAVAEALEYAHAHGVVHRDIKPENVLLTGRSAVVTDFGIAKALSLSQTRDAPAAGTLTQVGTSVGTPAYMAPEQAAGDDVDARADLYAWGMVAYELLAGQHPFADKQTARQLMAAQIGEAPIALGSRAPGVPAPLAALVMRTLEKDRARRPASAAELLAALDGYAGTHPPHTGSPHAGSPNAARRRARAAIGVGVAAALLAGAGVAWRSRHSVAGAESVGPLMLAVLPFENAGPAEQGVFTDGLTDAVTAKLGALPGLAVIDRQSAGQYRATTKPARQIGTELGVSYLVEGVVRWAKDGPGAWRAQVTPTLVDAKAGTTQWTGEPVVITPADPFTAQTQVATRVAEALRVALRPADRAALARRSTDNPLALAAYQRGRAAYSETRSPINSPAQLQRAAAEFERAVALDSTFGEAWGRLAWTRYLQATGAPGDRAAEAQARTALARARTHAPEEAQTLYTQVSIQTEFDRDTAGLDALMAHLIAREPDASQSLFDRAFQMDRHHQYDSAYALNVQAAALDPRSVWVVAGAAQRAMALRRWADARRYANAVIALDSTDERGWRAALAVPYAQGDTLGMQRLAARAVAHLPRPSSDILDVMAYAGGAPAQRYLALSTREYGAFTLPDSVNFYDTKMDILLRRRDVPRARVYADSMRRIIAGRALSGGGEAGLLSELAFAQAVLGDTAAARRTLTRAIALARATAAPTDSFNVLGTPVAGTYARLGEPETAVRWLEARFASGIAITAQGLRIEPKLLVLHGTSAFERLLRAHPD